MDTTNQYIKMCEKAIEIQEPWTPEIGDYVWRKYTLLGEEIDRQIWKEDQMKEIIILHYKSMVDGYFHACNEKGETRTFKTTESIQKATCVFLLRQDQLQAMVKEYLTSWQLTQYFWNWLWTKEPVTTCLSTEQLWLAFVMFEKFNKTWDGDDWQKGEGR